MLQPQTWLCMCYGVGPCRATVRVRSHEVTSRYLVRSHGVTLRHVTSDSKVGGEGELDCVCHGRVHVLWRGPFDGEGCCVRRNCSSDRTSVTTAACLTAIGRRCAGHPWSHLLCLVLRCRQGRLCTAPLPSAPSSTYGTHIPKDCVYHMWTHNPRKKDQQSCAGLILSGSQLGPPAPSPAPLRA